MTSADIVAFLNDAGLLATIRHSEEDGAGDAVAFKIRGTSYTVFSDERDPDFVNVTCAYRLQGVAVDKVSGYEAALQLQSSYKVVKVTVDYAVPSVTVAAEQFLARGDAFSRIFWRSVDLIGEVAAKAYEVLNDVSLADAAASAFTESVEQTLNLRRDGPEED